MSDQGFPLPNGCRAVHGTGANIRQPFADIPLVMHELDAGEGAQAYGGQHGFIPFTDALRLPRHIHVSADGRRLLPERILVFNGVALTELCGEVFLVAPGTLVEIAPGVPHTWTACPPGVELPDGTVSDGRFLMVYLYAEKTGFRPTARTAPLRDIVDDEPFAGDLEAIRFPALAASAVAAGVPLIWNREFVTGLRQVG